jgi:hypothetical protein
MAIDLIGEDNCTTVLQGLLSSIPQGLKRVARCRAQWRRIATQRSRSPIAIATSDITARPDRPVGRRSRSHLIKRNGCWRLQKQTARRWVPTSSCLCSAGAGRRRFDRCCATGRRAHGGRQRLAGAQPGVRFRGWHGAARGDRSARLPQNRQDSRAGCGGVDSTGATAQLRVAALRRRLAHRADLAPCRPQQHRCHRNRLPASAQPRSRRRCYRHGPHIPSIPI